MKRRNREELSWKVNHSHKEARGSLPRKGHLASCDQWGMGKIQSEPDTGEET